MNSKTYLLIKWQYFTDMEVNKYLPNKDRWEFICVIDYSNNLDECESKKLELDKTLHKNIKYTIKEVINPC